MLFKFAYDYELIDKPLRYHQWLQRPDKGDLRDDKRKRAQRNGKKFFTAAEIKQLLDAANPQMKAMILLAINCGCGNSDLGQLTFADLELKQGWLDSLRPKTKVHRRAKLWKETIAAIKVAQITRTAPKDDYEELVFLTHHGQSWHNDTPSNPLSREFRKLLQAVGLYRSGRGFYSMRHSFLTIAEETKDFPAKDLAMGHSDNSMAAEYREDIDDSRLEAIADHVHNWLFDKQATSGSNQA